MGHFLPRRFRGRPAVDQVLERLATTETTRAALVSARDYRSALHSLYLADSNARKAGRPFRGLRSWNPDALLGKVLSDRSLADLDTNDARRRRDAIYERHVEWGGSVAFGFLTAAPLSTLLEVVSNADVEMADAKWFFASYAATVVGATAVAVRGHRRKATNPVAEYERSLSALRNALDRFDRQRDAAQGDFRALCEEPCIEAAWGSPPGSSDGPAVARRFLTELGVDWYGNADRVGTGVDDFVAAIGARECELLDVPRGFSADDVSRQLHAPLDGLDHGFGPS